MEKMSELLAFSVQAVNLPFTLLFLLTLLYWLSVILGAMDIDFLDVDLDFDGDVDIDMDADVDVDVGAEAPVMGVGFVFLKFLNVGRVPMVIIMSVLFTSTWVISMLSNFYFNPAMSKLLALAFLVPNLVISLAVTKVISTPFAWFFGQLTRDTMQSEDLTGKICVVMTTTVTSEFGQAEVKTEGAPLLINARTEGEETLSRGDQAVIMRFDKVKDIYVISKLEV